MSERRNWTREELILAFNLYCKIPFGQYNHRNSEVIALANIIGRTPSSVAFKLGNFASLDPYHQARGIGGLPNIGKLDKEIYSEFSNNWDELVFESELLLAQKLPTEDSIIKEVEKEIKFEERVGKEVIRSVKARVNQAFFRKVVLSIYDNKCAVSNIDLPKLLIASHIIPWSKNEKERVNPSNGICLSPLYDRVFDEGFMTISEDYTIVFSDKLREIKDPKTYRTFFANYEHQPINLPNKFQPNQEFLKFHREVIFKN